MLLSIKSKFASNLSHISCLFIWLILYNLPPEKYVLITLTSLGLLASFLILKKIYSFQPGLILFIFISFYLIYLIPVFFYGIPIASHYMYNKPEYYKITLQIFVLFMLMINLFLKKGHSPILLKDKIPHFKSHFLFYLFAIVQLLIIVQTVLTASAIGGSSSYDTYVNNLENSNGLWEYYYIFFILSFIFSPSKLHTKSLTLFFILYVYVSITRGYRIQMIEMMILFFILFLDGKFKNFSIIMTSLLGLISMELYGIWKVIGSFDWERIISSYESFDKILISNQTEVFYSTTGFIINSKLGIIDIGTRLTTFLAFIINFIVPTGVLWKGSRILDYMYNTDIGGGGFCFGYFYVWLGLLGVVLISYFISWNINNRFSNNKLKVTYLIFLIALSPRWFAYEPTNHLIRLPLTLLIMLSIIVFIFNKKFKY